MSSQFPPPPPLPPSDFHSQTLQNDGRATASMVCGIVGLILCGIVLGPVAIWLAMTSGTDAAGRRNGKATAGLVLGIIDVVFFFVGIAILAGR